MAEIIYKYFPELTNSQKDQILALEDIYSFWNSKVNTISRKDFQFFYERHVLHSLSILKLKPLDPSSTILDFGTGGGFPGIPLALLNPNSHFLLVDSIQKKIKVVEEVVRELSLANVDSKWCRVETLDKSFDYVTGRAVKEIPKFIQWVKPLLNKKSQKKNSGVLYLKGGDFDDELKKIKMKHEVYELNQLFNEDFFETKKLVHFYL